MKITNIKRTSGSKYELLIEGKKNIIYEDVLLEFNIYKPCEIAKEVYEQIIASNDFWQGYYKAIKYINFKMRTEKEVYQKLNSLKISKQQISKIIFKLKEEGYIDNKKYAKAFILDQLKLTLNGPKKIAIQLKQKGISDIIISKELQAIDKEAFKNNAQRYINKKVKVNNSGSLTRLQLKLKNDLYNLGYPEEYYEDLLENICINEETNYQKDKLKIEKTLAKKYSGEELELKVKQKLYALGYRK